MDRIRLFAEQLNEMISIAGLNDIGDFALTKRVGRILKARYKLTFWNKTEITTSLGGTGILRVLLRQSGKIGSSLKLCTNLLDRCASLRPVFL